MTPQERYDAYLVCLVRGHSPSGFSTAGAVPYQSCDWCGTYYRFETKMIEMPSSIPTKEEE